MYMKLDFNQVKKGNSPVLNMKKDSLFGKKYAKKVFVTKDQIRYFFC